MNEFRDENNDLNSIEIPFEYLDETVMFALDGKIYDK